MSAIVPFNFAAPAVARERRVSKINQEVMIGGASFPVLSIKGKVFTLVKDNERKVMMRKITDDDGNVEEMPVAALQLAVVRANARSRVFYASGYVEGESDGNKPTCFSHDGQYPDPSSEKVQSKNCQLCPHAAWGSKQSADGQGKGTACTVNTRLAVVDPTYPKTPFLLRVPAGSRANFNDAVKLADTHGYDYNQIVLRVSFDAEAPSPKLKFEPKGLLGEEVQAKVTELFDDPVVKDIVGVVAPRGEGAESAAQPDPKPEAKAETPAPREAEAKAVAEQVVQKAKAKPAVTESDLGSALGSALGDVVEAPAKAAAKPKAKPAAKVEDAVVRSESNAGQASAGDVGGLLGELSGLLGNTDD